MKNKIYLLITLIFFLTNISYSQQIPNSDFENWETPNSAIGWTCGVVVGPITINTATRSNDAYSGNYCAKMQTKALFTGDVVPGMIQLGQLDIDELEPYGGIPYEFRPSALQFKAKYEQQGGDSMIVACYLTKYKNNETIIVGGTWYVHTEDINDYQTITTPIYYLKELTPDTINIFFSSSYKTPHEGSTLYLDDLKILFGDYFLAPTANKPTKISTTEFTAEWLGADYTSNYILDVASDFDFNNKIIDNQNVGDTNRYTVEIPDTSIKTIFYRVKAKYDTTTTEYSNIMEFPVPHAPKCYNATKIRATSFYANWENLTLNDYYILDVALDSNFTKPLDNYKNLVLDTNIFLIKNLTPETDYYFRTRARYIISEISKFSNITKVTTKKETEKPDLKILTLKQKIAFETDSSFQNAELILYNSRGELYYKNTIKDKYIEIQTPSNELFIIYIKKANGDIIRKKLGVIVD